MTCSDEIRDRRQRLKATTHGFFGSLESRSTESIWGSVLPLFVAALDILSVGITAVNPLQSRSFQTLYSIFAYLGLADRLAAGLTCKRWHRCAADSRVYGDVVVVLEKNVKERMIALSDSDCVITRLVVKNCTLDPDTEFWKRVGRTLKMLYLNDCRFYWKEFVSVILECPKLEHVTISRYDKSISPSGESGIPDAAPPVSCSKASRIISVDLTNNPDLTDGAFNAVMNVVGNVDTLSLEGCALCVNEAIYRRFYPYGQAHSPLVLTFQDVLRSLEGAPIRVLNLSYTMIDSICLAQLSAAYSKTLRELHAVSCVQLRTHGVRVLCENVPKLTCLNLASNWQLKDDCLQIICESLQHLERLDMSHCRNITYVGFTSLAHLRKLRYASFSDCVLEEPETMVQHFSARPWPAIQLLNISSCGINDAVAKCISEGMPTLVFLDVSQTSLLTDDAVRAIWTHLRLLRVLRMADCSNITDEALHRPGSLEECEPTSMACLAGLKELNLGGCHLVSDAGVSAAVFFPELTSLDIGRCTLLTPASLKHIALHCPSLSKLVLRFCVQLDDGALTPVLRYLHRLRHLNIAGCRNVTDATIRNIAQCPSVKYVNIESCMVTPNAVQQLVLERPDLEVEHTACSVE
ncbi:hypothetical protein HPB50_000624 [Hyalomma asiaticum]|uniref:Uncharacterized protein n=1 Tax=Hyalomma asiaticum TaxID=266040 RepID=A0ACB7TA75_HYAAI|nr:hypothetical protein HPB50_000624 [Hyalomma asiaticum]